MQTTRGRIASAIIHSRNRQPSELEGITAGPTEQALGPWQLQFVGNGPPSIFNVSGVAETPAFSSSALRMVASHWRFSPMFVFFPVNQLLSRRARIGH